MRNRQNKWITPEDPYTSPDIKEIKAGTWVIVSLTEKEIRVYLVTIPKPSESIFLKSAEDINDGSLHISFVTGLNSVRENKTKMV